MQIENIPKSWKQVTLGQWCAMSSLPKDILGEETELRMISILIGCTKNDLRRLPIREYNALKEMLQFTNTPPEPVFTKRFVIDGKELILSDLSHDLSVGMFIDLEEDIAQQNIANIIGRIYRENTPDGIAPYDGQTIRYEMLENVMTAEEAFGVSTFFMMLGTASLELIHKSSQAVPRTMTI